MSHTLRAMTLVRRSRAAVRGLGLLAVLGLSVPVQAQVPAAVPAPAAEVENVRTDYAQVLRAEPVYQTLRATSMVERCEPPPGDGGEAGGRRSGLGRVVDAVRGAVNPEARVEEVAPSAGGTCRMVPLEREFRRAVAWDVDYVYKGVKYRSRLPYDPGNRLQVRVSVTPVVQPR